MAFLKFHFRTLMEVGKNLRFPNHIAGNHNGQFDGEKFKAPTSGRYQIRLQLVIVNNAVGISDAYHYEVRMKRSGSD